jgi:hypothetical protein
VRLWIVLAAHSVYGNRAGCSFRWNLTAKQSPIEPLFEEAALEGWERRLRAELQADSDHRADLDLDAFKHTQSLGVVVSAGSDPRHADHHHVGSCERRHLRRQSHDVMFLGETLTHSPCPVSTLYAAALLTTETLIIDDYFQRQDAPLDFYVATAPRDGIGASKAGQFVFVAVPVPEILVIKALRIAGVLPSNIRRLRDPIEGTHTMIIADMRGARERREQELWHPYLRSMIGMEREPMAFTPRYRTARPARAEAAGRN